MVLYCFFLKQIEWPVSTILRDKTAKVKLIFCKLGCFSKTDLVLSIYRANFELYLSMKDGKKLLASSIVVMLANLSSGINLSWNDSKSLSIRGLNSGTLLVSIAVNFIRIIL